VQEQDYRTQSGIGWQIDWSTWSKALRLDPQSGLFSEADRVQSGRNLDRMPDLSNGWAEIEIGWPSGTPAASPTGYFGPMVGFRKEINREENVEVIPIGQGGGDVNLALEAWVGSPIILAQWQMPLIAAGGSRIPEPGDIIRVRWAAGISATDLNVRASYFDASANRWYVNVIDHTFDASALPGGAFGPVDFTDGYHTASSVTIDSPSYSIRRYKVGTLSTYPAP
jgi:hypothetical protein